MILIDNNIDILNERKFTHFHVQTGTLSSIDLALCFSILPQILDEISVWTSTIVTIFSLS